MFEAYPIAKLLGNKRPELAIRNYIDRSCCNNWKELKTYLFCKSMCIFQLILPPVHIPTHWRSNTLFINEEGVISLINNSTLPVANKFKWWFFGQKAEAVRPLSLFSGSPDPFHMTQPLFTRYEPEIDILAQDQIAQQQSKRDKTIVAKQHQQQRRQQLQQRPMVMQNMHKRPTHRNGTRGSTTPKACK